MKAVWTALGKAAPQLLIAIALLAVAGVLGARAVFTGAEAFGVVTLVLGAAGVSVGTVLGSSSANVNTIPHLLVLIFALGVLTALALLHVVTDAQVFGTLTLGAGGALGSTAFASGSSSTPPTTTVVSTTTGNTVTAPLVLASASPVPAAAPVTPPPAGLQQSEAVSQAQAAVAVAQSALQAAGAAPADPASAFPPGTIVQPAVAPTTTS
ncbi:MAG: hypothetical protein KGL39_29895 [Patescibacteria group bacterium]|nr:hypothetical protein [Patescibacteria group bacterium]